MTRFLNWFKKKIRPSLCTDCRNKLDGKFHIKHVIKRHGRKLKRNTKRNVTTAKRKLKTGIHKVIIRGKLRKVKVLKNGQWRFMK